MPPTARQLNRATLGRQLLLRREALPVVEAVRRIVALQAQEPASPYVALWNRVERFDPDQLDRAFSTGEVVKASLMRITLHAVASDEYPTFHEAMVQSLRASRLFDRRFKETGLEIADADALLPHLSEFATQPRSKAEIEQMFAEVLGEEPHSRLWWALRTFAPVRHAPVDDIWSFGRLQTFITAPTVPPRPDADAALQILIRRYLEGFGPASVADFAQFTMKARTTAREALAEMADSLVRLEGPAGIELWDVPDGTVPDEDVDAPPRLLAMWDSILLAYHDRSRVIPEEYRKLVIRRNGDVLPTFLVDGRVAGVWRAKEDGIEALAFAPLSDEAWRGLDQEARSLREMLAERDPRVYSRYRRWWEQLPDGEVRVLGA